MTHVATLIGSERACRRGDARARQPAGRRRAANGSAPARSIFPLARIAASTNARWPSNCASLADGIDVVVQPAAGRRKKLFLADMDSTMIGQECIDELADYVGLKAQVAAITERAMRGEIDFEPALRERVALLKGLPVSVIEEVLRRAHHAHAGRAHAGRDHARARRAHRAWCPAASPMFTDRIAAMIGFDEARANTLTVLDGRQACRQGRRADLRPRRQARRADRAARSSSGSPRPRPWRSATAPTTST